LLVAGPIAVVASLVLAASASAVNLGETAQVTTNTDNGGAGCELREAIAAVTASSDFGGCTVVDTNGLDDHVTFAPAMSGQTIILDGTELDVNDTEADLDITGPGMNQFTISGNDASRIFKVETRTGITGMSLVQGKAPEVSDFAQGGAIESTAVGVNALVLTDVRVADSAATADSSVLASAQGGGIHTTGGPLTLNQSVVTGNFAGAVGTSGAPVVANGGGIFHEDDMTLNDSTISDNDATATTDGSSLADATAGISAGAHLEVSGSTISGNDAIATATGLGGSANARGGLFQAGSSSASSVEQSTIAGNTADSTAGTGGIAFEAGGVDIANDTDIVGSTIALNGPATLTDNIDGANIVVECCANTVENTIIANPRGLGQNCSGVLTSNGFNDDSTGGVAVTSCFSTPQSTDLTSDPLLAAGGLAPNGGLTQTIALQPTSPMIDKGSNADLADPTQDQRGASFTRPVDFSGLANAAGGNGTDIGAFEVQQACPGFTQSTPSTACPTPPAPTPTQPVTTTTKKKKCKKAKKGASSAKKKKCKKKK
jgi:hypothetical protein